jgi:hypothetical protein
MSICTIVVHRPLAQPVLSGPLELGYEYGRCPILIHTYRTIQPTVDTPAGKFVISQIIMD